MLIVKPGDKIIIAICDALGVDPNGVYGFELYARVGKPLRLTVIGWPQLTEERLAQLADGIGELASDFKAATETEGDDASTG